MSEEKQSLGSIEFSDISNSEIRTGDINTTIQAGGDIVSRDKNIFQPVINLFTGTSDQQRDLRNRQVMLTAVQKFWVEGVLENSLHGAALIELGMEEKKEAVHYPWDMVLQRPKQSNRQLPPGTKMIDVFDRAGRSLLILGEPGSGKTTMLLELARQTIEQADKDLAQPIPVVFNLSSWAEKQPPLAGWVVDELNTKYQIPKKLAQTWVEKDELLLLLDGLDEVAQPYRVACIETINIFHKDNLTPLVVCSRVADYEVLSTKLNLEQAIILRPLTEHQVGNYLANFGPELDTLRTFLHSDSDLQELALSPLMLSIMVLAYKGIPTQELPLLETVEIRRKHVFNTYVQAILMRRSVSQSYSIEQITCWLSWLARQMQQHSQSIFFIEYIQPSWLETAHQNKWYSRIVGVSMLLTGTGMAFAGLSLDKVEPVEAITWSWRKAFIQSKKSLIASWVVLIGV